MAGAQLVPHKLPNGQTVMVPDYLLPKQQPALALPNVAPPAAGPDLRTAEVPKNTILGVDMDNPWGSSGSSRAPGGPQTYRPSLADYAGGGYNPRSMVEPKKEEPDKPKEQSAPEDADPSDLVPLKLDPRRPSGSTQDTALALFGEKQRTGASIKPPDPNNLNLVAAEVKQERQPGQRLLREQEWRLGISERPNFADEIDPDAQQPTIGTEEPIRRKYLTPLERGANQAGDAAKREFQRQVEEQKLLGVAQQSALVQQSELLDSQLNTIADRRNRIAQLQETADRRMQEAESAEPRTRGEVWESKGALGQVIAMFGVALSAYGASLNRTGKNQSWEMINQVLNDEVEGERDRAERRFRIGQAAKNDVERAHALYGDLDAAMLESKNRKIANVMAVMQQQMANKAFDETARVQGAAVYALAQEQYLANKQQLFDMITGKVTKEEATLKPYGEVIQKATPKPVGVGGGGAAGGKGAGAPYGISAEEYRKFTKEERSMSVKLPAGITMPGGRPDGVAFVRDPSVRHETQQRLASLNRMRGNLQQIQKWRQDKGKTLPWSEARGKISALAGDFTLGVKSGEQLGALDVGSVEFMTNLIGNPEQFTVLDETTDGKIKQQMKTIDAKIRSIMQNELDNSTLEITAGGQSTEGIEE